MKLSNFHAAFLQLLILTSLFKFSIAIKKSYVVVLGAHRSYGEELAPLDPDQVKRHHHRVLGKVIRSTSKAQRRIHYSYMNHLNAFTALLTENEVVKLTKHPEVISVLESKRSSTETTHSWEFLGFEKNGQVVPNSLWEKAKQGEDMIIAGVDSGIWPETKSISDEGMGPIPPKWKGGGACDLDPKDGPTCNRKLIGARMFIKANRAECIEHVRAKVIVGDVPDCFLEKSARDTLDHGTHTLATAGGSLVPGASQFGLAGGTLKGGAPRARLVGYKTLNGPGYTFRLPNGTVVEAVNFHEGDKLAAFDDAIANGADVITMSLSNDQHEYSDDLTAIGSFHAVMHGVVFVAAAANTGPVPASVKNLSPWMLSVGASTTDRSFRTSVVLGNKQTFKGIAMYEKEKSLPPGMQYPLITGIEAKVEGASDEAAHGCETLSLDPAKLKGKILICTGRNGPAASRVLLEAGGIGVINIIPSPVYKILWNTEHFTTLLPSVALTYSDGEAVYAYHKSTTNPTAYLTPVETEIASQGDPIVASFSARGPNPVEPSVLKPDVIAPGVDILGPSCGVRGPINPYLHPDAKDTRRVPFFVEPGTSFAAPHVAGIAALLKSIHPDWSPAAIKSALMTTATTTQYGNDAETIMDVGMNRMTPFDYGAGHVSPNQADDPGLVYDLTLEDYLNFLCARGYDERRLKLFDAKPYACPPTARLLDFNYPAITIPNLEAPVAVTRRLKNVGPEGTYTVKVSAPPGVDVTVDPLTLKFGKVGEEQTFKAEFKPIGDKAGKYVFGELTWSDGVHFVKSPLSVKH